MPEHKQLQKNIKTALGMGNSAWIINWFGSICSANNLKGIKLSYFW